MEHHIKISDALKFGWAKTRAHSMLIFQVLLTMFAVQVAQQIVTRTIGDTLEGGLANVFLFILSIAIGIGFTNIGLLLAKGEHAKYRDIIPSWSLGIAYIAANLLAGIVVVLPILAALILGLLAYALLPTTAAIVVIVCVAVLAFVVAAYLALRYSFVRFVILEEDEITDSLRTSAKLTFGRKWWLLGFLIVLGLINIVGAALLLVGLLVTMPVTLIAYAHVYRTLRAHHG